MKTNNCLAINFCRPGVLSCMLFSILLLSCATSPALNKNEPPAQTSILEVSPDLLASKPQENPQVSQRTSRKTAPQAAKSGRKINDTGTTKDIVALPASTVQIFGDSTFKKFSSTATQLGIRVKVVPPPKTPEDILSAKLDEFVLIIPVAGMKSGNDTLDGHLSEALEAKKYPLIRGVVQGYETHGKNADGSTRVTATVALTIAGTSKTLPVDATLTIKGNQARIQGEKELLMTDFGVTPPTLMLGVIKVADKITIRFDLVLGLI